MKSAYTTYFPTAETLQKKYKEFLVDILTK